MEKTTSLTGFCVKCRKKRELINPEEVEMKNNRPALRGVCRVCGTKLFRIIKRKNK